MTSQVAIPNVHDFKNQLNKIFKKAEQLGCVAVEIQAREFHLAVGGYTGKEDNRMNACCHVLHKAISDSDTIITAPPSGNGASLHIRYSLPRPK